MRTLLILLSSLGMPLAAVSSKALAGTWDKETESWSKPVSGLQARFSFANKETFNGTPILTTYLELRNVSDVANVIEIPLDPQKIRFRITDSTGKAISPTNGPFDGTSVELGLLRLPFDSYLRFNIASRGAGVAKDARGHVDLGAEHNWTFPRGNTETYYLNGTLTIDKTKAGHWYGTIEIPKAKIPLK